MTETGIVLPWWLLSLLAGVLLTLLAWKRAVIRRGCESFLVSYLARCDKVRAVLGVQLERRREQTSQAFSVFAEHYGKMRYRLSIIDFMQLLSIRWQRVEALCTDTDALIASASHELENARMERPEAPEWVVAADAIAKLPGDKAQPATAKILRAMLDAAQSHHEETLREFRWAAAVRGRALMESERYWRRLTARMGDIEAYWCDVKRASEKLVNASSFVDQLLRQDNRRRVMRGVLSGALSTLTLAVTIGLSFYLLQTLTSLLPAEAGSGRAWSVVVLLVLLVLGTVLASACRWTDTLLPIAELGRRWRFWLGALALTALVGLSYAVMEMPVAEFSRVLIEAGWGAGAAVNAAAVLYAVPVFVAFQLPLLEHWWRAARPVTSFALERILQAVLAFVGLQQMLCRAMLSLFSGDVERPAQSSDGIKLVADNSGKKAS